MICNATLRAVGLNEFDISQRSYSVRTAERAIVLANVRAATRRVSVCVEEKWLCVAGVGRAAFAEASAVEVDAAGVDRRG